MEEAAMSYIKVPSGNSQEELGENEKLRSG
jgi:hypothetical protein